MEEFQSKSLAQFHKDYFQEENIPITKNIEAFAGILNLNGTSLQNLLDDEQVAAIIWTVEEEKDKNNIMKKQVGKTNVKISTILKFKNRL